MQLRILAVGDVVGEGGVDFLSRHLHKLKREHGIHFTVVNGENAGGMGLLPAHARDILDAGADVITLGNHPWHKRQIVPMVQEEPRLLRPANYTDRAPGRGFGVFEGPEGISIGVLNLIGRCGMDSNFDNPFTVARQILAKAEAQVVLVDFHAEATSEKGAMAHYLDGRVQALWGTHTHVPTADAQVLPKGTGFVTDLGMTGPAVSVLGMRPAQAIGRFLGELPSRFEPAGGPCKLESAVFEIDTHTRRCTRVFRADLREDRKG